MPLLCEARAAAEERRDARALSLHQLGSDGAAIVDSTISYLPGERTAAEGAPVTRRTVLFTLSASLLSNIAAFYIVVGWRRLALEAMAAARKCQPKPAAPPIETARAEGFE